MSSDIKPSPVQHIHSHTTSDDVASALGTYVAECSALAIATSGRFTLAISGGSLPKLLGQGLSSQSGIEFSKWQVFFADERCVALDHADSNYAACATALFNHVSIPRDQIHTISWKNDDPFTAAQEYATQLAATWPSSEYPVFDLILLGMGPDGHTCSLFPHHKLLEETQAWVAPICDSPKPPLERITLTLPVLNHAQQVAFVTTGTSKAEVLHRILDLKDETYPAARVQPFTGTLHWFIDAPAGEKLENSKK